MEKTEKKEPVCCPPFDPAPWHDKVFEWDNKKFIRDRIMTFFFMPLNFGQKMKKLDNLVTRAGGLFPDAMSLSDHISKWSMDIYMAVDKDIPGVENTTLSGKFFSRVYEGPFSDTGKWCKDSEDVAKARDLSIKKWYMWYTTCPKCAKKYGKNYVVIITQVD